MSHNKSDNRFRVTVEFIPESKEDILKIHERARMLAKLTGEPVILTRDGDTPLTIEYSPEGELCSPSEPTR